MERDFHGQRRTSTVDSLYCKLLLDFCPIATKPVKVSVDQTKLRLNFGPGAASQI